MDETLIANFALLRVLSLIKMNLISLIKNENQSMTSLAKNYAIVSHMMISEGIPREQAVEIAKAKEIELAHVLKSLISRITFDSAYDTSLLSVINYLPVRNVNGVMAIDSRGLLSDHVGILEGAVDRVDEAISENIISLLQNETFDSLSNVPEVIMEASSPKDSVIQNTKASATFVVVEIPYITGNGEVKYVNNTLQVEIVPHYVRDVDLQDAMVDLDPAKLIKKYTKLTAKQLTFMKGFLLEIDRMERVAKLNAKHPNNILNFIRQENVKKKISSAYMYPFAILFVDNHFTDTLQRENNINLEKDNIKVRYMKEMSLISLMIYNTVTDIMSVINDGENKSKNATYSDWVLGVSKFEKELNQIIRLNSSR